ncbi:hypothetical protein Vi05172_g3607 [Venturia inaequalis]|nr:hypothetical protein Vi05172_g3607 [Venturia inaequalis]
MGCHPEANIEAFWNTNEEQGAIHRQVQICMSLRRWQWLDHCLYLAETRPLGTTSTGDRRSPFEKVEILSNHLITAFQKYYVPGSHCSIDETIQGFSGRAFEIVNIPTKPTPEGFKIWVIAEAGYVISWLFHAKGKGKGPVGLNDYWKKEGWNDTQSVVLTLAQKLPNGGRGYALFLDNLFNLKKLFQCLRKEGIGAAGTVRLQSTKAELIEAGIDPGEAEKLQQ